MTHRPLGLLFLSFAALNAWLAIRFWPWGIPLLWVATAYVIAGLAYFTGRSALLGKRSDGTVTPWLGVLCLPYLGLCIIASFARRLSREPAWNEVSPGLFVGRRVTAAALPPDTQVVVDLTSEFAEPAAVREGRAYRCLPTMDGCSSEPEAFAALAREVAAMSGRVFVHCAVGHGRSASLAAAVIILRGLAPDVEAAEAMMKRARPGIGLGGEQKGIVTRATRR